MGWFGGSSQKPGDEFDLGNSRYLNSWTNKYESGYEYIRHFIESKIGTLQITDGNLQNKLSNMVVTSRKDSYEEWVPLSKKFLKVTIDGNNTVVNINRPNYNSPSDYYHNSSIISGLKKSLGHIGFNWNRGNRYSRWKHRGYYKTNSTMTLDELAHAIGMDRVEGKNIGLEKYCEQVAYSQEMKGIPNTFSVSDKIDHDVGIDDKCTECGEEIPLLRRKALPDAKTCVNCSPPEDSKDKIDISESKSSDNPYSKVEQLEKLIALRNEGEISPEEFDNLKKELLS